MPDIPITFVADEASMNNVAAIFQRKFNLDATKMGPGTSDSGYRGDTRRTTQLPITDMLADYTDFTGSMMAAWDKAGNTKSGGGGGAAIAGALTSPLDIATGLILADALKEMVKNSKILSTFLGTISNLLGLLLDLVLLPFVPILTGAIIALYQGIMIFGNAWNATIKPFISGSSEDKKKASGVIGATLTGALLTVPETLMELIVGWILGPEAAKTAHDTTVKLNLDIGSTLGEWVYTFIQMFIDPKTDWIKKLTFSIELSNPLPIMIDILKWIYELFNNPEKALVDLKINLLKGLGGDLLWNIAAGLANTLYPNAQVPTVQTGPNAPSPDKQTQLINNTYNFNGTFGDIESACENALKKIGNPYSWFT